MRREEGVDGTIYEDGRMVSPRQRTAQPPAGPEMPEGWRYKDRIFLNQDGHKLTVPLMRALLASQGYVVERECPEHGRSCWGARCDVRGE